MHVDARHPPRRMVVLRKFRGHIDLGLEKGLEEARERAAAYANAGASGFFVPGLVDLHAIAKLCDTIGLPLNVMMMPGLPDMRSLAGAGVARISYGPAPYLRAMEATANAAQDVVSQSKAHLQD